LLSYFLLHERLSLQKIIGIIIGLAGLFPVLAATASSENTDFFSLTIPEGVMLCAVISAAYAWFMVIRLLANGYPLVLINGTTMLTGGILSMVTAACFEGIANPVHHWPNFLGWV